MERKEVEDRIDEANKTATDLQQSTNLLLLKIVEIQSDTIVQAADTQRIIEEIEKKVLIQQKQADERIKEEKAKEEKEARYRTDE